jgi:hypothetical protein
MTHDHQSDIPLHRTYILFTYLHFAHSISFSFQHANLICHFITSYCHSLQQCSAAVLRGHLKGHKKGLPSIETVRKGLHRTSLRSTLGSPAPSFGMFPNNASGRIGLTSSSCFRPPDDTILASRNKRPRRCRSGGGLP